MWLKDSRKESHLKHHRLAFSVSHCILFDLIDASEELRHLLPEIALNVFLNSKSNYKLNYKT